MRKPKQTETRSLAKVTGLVDRTEMQPSRHCHLQTPTSEFKNCPNCSLSLTVLKFLLQKFFTRRVCQDRSRSNTVVFKKAGPRGLASGCFYADRKESAFSLGQGSMKSVLGSGGMAQGTATLSHVRRSVPCLSPGSAWGPGINRDRKWRWHTTQTSAPSAAMTQMTPGCIV